MKSHINSFSFIPLAVLLFVSPSFAAGEDEKAKECDLRLMVVSDGNTENEIRKFEKEVEPKKKECAVLIVRATSDSDKWTIAGFSDAGQFREVEIDDRSHELAGELNKIPTNESRIIELATSSLGRTQAKDAMPSIEDKTEGMENRPGFFDFYWDKEEGEVWLLVEKWDSEFLYVNALATGVGSNDIRLDRNQLGENRVVKFQRIGRKVLLVQPNYDYRAVTDNVEERRSVEEAFAQSVLWGFKVEAETQDQVLINITPFLLRDAHGIVSILKNSKPKQGDYAVDDSRSAIYLERTKNFPDNSEFEGLITYKGSPDPQGSSWIRSVTPTPEFITVRQHHSFVRLPDNEYEPRVFDPRSGYSSLSYQDYATPIADPLVKRLILRHRLRKKHPEAKVSEPVEPIVYYLDRGAPEPIKSALIEGASWWNQAFEAAGYKDAFIVKELPEGADLLDVRYNVINWVHRSTRGWSYGSSVFDPRTGEILKGHVLLGSLRVRQDFLIVQGLLKAYEDGVTPDPRMKETALARLRQLSAHEVGHTLGLAHNFSSSTDNRSSVMDYPYPYIKLDEQGGLDFSEAYDADIGDWDKRTILYGYQDFPDGVEESKGLEAILTENEALGLSYLSDQDARPNSSAHPNAHLWDNGSAVDELKRLSFIRKVALANFGINNIRNHVPMADLERVLVPLYLAHRYQVEAVSKLIGGVNYSYATRGSELPRNEMIEDALQRDALEALLSTLKPGFLNLPENIIQLIPPQPIGYRRDRELFKVNTGLTFDPIAAAESSANNTIRLLLNPERLARLVEQHARDNNRMSIYDMFDELLAQVSAKADYTSFDQEIARMVEKLVVENILGLAANNNGMKQVTAAALYKINLLEKTYEQTLTSIDDAAQLAHFGYLLREIKLFKDHPEKYEPSPGADLPDGSPIGCETLFSVID